MPFAPSLGSPFAVGNNPVSIATADLNGDGHLDLLTTNYISDNVSVLAGNGHGQFSASAPVPVTNGPREIAVGDLDGDGDIDFLATNYSGNNVSVALNNGNGTFAAATSVAVGAVPRGLAAGDLDGDGDLDFVSVNYQSNNLSVMLNNGNGSFAQAAGSPVATGTRPVAIVLANFDGDSDLDIAVTNNSNNNVSILLNNGSAGFTPAAGSPASVGTGPRGIGTGDFDGDGDRDLAVAIFGAASLSILLNNGSAGFSAGPTLTTGNNPYAVRVADFDGDGDFDVAVTNSGSSSVNAFLNNGSAVFTPDSGSPFAVGVSPGGIAAGDFDEDGDRDLATANFGSNTVGILLNTTPIINDGNHAPVITSNGGGDTATIAVPQNATAVTNVRVADFDGNLVGFSIVGGTDAARFRINAENGALSFIDAPIFDAPTDSDHNNSYVVQVRATDNFIHPRSDAQTITVNVVQQFQLPAFKLGAFGLSAGGWTSDDRYHRELADVNGDGMADIVGFGDAGVFVSLATGNGAFGPIVQQLAAFGASGGWSSNDKYPRELADVNGDGMADIVGFGDAGVFVSLATGGGSFGPVVHRLAAFGAVNGGWTSDNKYHRELADVNGDGMADIVGFGDAGVFVSLATGGGNFGTMEHPLAAFGNNTGGWFSDDRYPRHLGDLNGDGMADIVGFADAGVYVSFATDGGAFGPPSFQLAAFGANNGWFSDDRSPRELADVNGDGRADIVGFGDVGLWVALGKGDGSFQPITSDLDAYGPNVGGWTSQNIFPRYLADVNHDGAADVVAFGAAGVYESLSSSFHLI